MKKKPKLVDGFSFKQSSSNNLDDFNFKKNKVKPTDKKTIINQLDDSDFNDFNDISINPNKTYKNHDFSNLDISESLQNIDNEEVELPEKIGRRQRRKNKKLSKKLKKLNRPHKLLRRIIKLLVVILLLCGIGYGGYIGYKFIKASNNVFRGSIFQIFQNVPLKQDENGRSNFLILGTSEDDPGHEAAYLTDSMLVLSINQTTHDAYMFSVPRDLYVEYGEACPAGYAGKINAYFYCVSDGDTDEDEQNRLAKTQSLIGGIFGLDIQYGAHINYTVVRELVDAVDGIDVDIQGSNGEPGILDRTFDYICNYTCFNVKYDNGVHHLTGQQALYLAMARGHEAPTYGLSRSNFDREVNQQKIIIALKDKASSTGVLTDLNKITSIVDALGNNLRTTIQTNEIRTLADIASKTSSNNIHRLSLVGDDGSNSLLTTAHGDVVPIAGEFNYGDIQAYIHDMITSNPIAAENAPIAVFNGTDQSGFAQTKADELKAAGYNVSLVDNAPDGKYEKVEVYQIGSGNSATANALASLYSVTIKTTTPPISVGEDIRFVIILGSTN